MTSQFDFQQVSLKKMPKPPLVTAAKLSERVCNNYLHQLNSLSEFHLGFYMEES